MTFIGTFFSKENFKDYSETQPRPLLDLHKTKHYQQNLVYCLYIYHARKNRKNL